MVPLYILASYAYKSWHLYIRCYICVCILNNKTELLLNVLSSSYTAMKMVLGSLFLILKSYLVDVNSSFNTYMPLSLPTCILHQPLYYVYMHRLVKVQVAE